MACGMLSQAFAQVRDFIKYAFNIILCWDTSEPISLKLDAGHDLTLPLDFILDESDVHSKSQFYGKL